MSDQDFIVQWDRNAGTSALDDILQRHGGDTSLLAPPMPGSLGSAPEGRSTWETVKAVGRDVAGGAVEAPGAVIKGASAAVREMLESLDAAGNWLNENVVDLRLPSTGIGLLDNPLGAAAKGAADLPEISERETVTGRGIQGVSQFLTGLATANIVLPAAGGAGAAVRYGRSLLAGAGADAFAFDPDDANLSNLIQSVPELQNPVTEFLATDPNDSDAVNRFKRAAEGAVSSVAIDGLVAGLRAYRARNAAKRAAGTAERKAVDAAEMATEAKAAAQAERDFLVLGDVNAPLVRRVEMEKPATVTRQVMKEGEQAAAFGEPRVQADILSSDVTPRLGADDAARLAENAGGPVRGLEVNFARINSPDDIKAAIQQLARQDVSAIEAARRGVRTHAETAAAAEGVDAFDVMMRRRAEGGTTMPRAEEQLALRTLWTSSAEKLQEVATRAAATQSPGDLFAFRKMMATHYAIQREVMAVRTETARALNQWAIPAGVDAARLRQITDLLDDVGGQQFNAEMARRVAALAKVAPDNLDTFIEKSFMAKTGDALREAWTNALLSNPKTHIVNIMSNTAVAAQTLAERWVAGKFSQALGSGEIYPSEALFAAFGQVEGLKQALKVARTMDQAGTVWRALGGDPNLMVGPSKIEGWRRAISSEGFGLTEGSTGARIANGLGAVVGAPGRALEAEDVLFKSVGYWQEVFARSARQASEEVASGALAPDRLKVRIAELAAHTPDDIAAAAANAAAYQTFTGKPGPIAASILRAKQQVPALHFIIPFVRTPSNIFNFVLERTPLAPLMQRFRTEYAAGGARRDLALTKMAMGSAALALSVDLANQGLISGRGPSDSGERANLQRQGWQPYSVKIGDRWFSYQRGDPLAMTLGFGADLAHAFRDGDFADGFEVDAERAIAAAALGLAGNSLSKTYMSGLADTLEALQDPKRYGESWVQRFAGSVVPAAVAEVARATDPTMRASADLVDALFRRVPGLSADLPAVRDLWGRQRTYSSGLGAVYDALVPSVSKAEAPEPIDVELKRLRHFPEMPAKTQTFPASDGKSVAIPLANRPDLYYRFVELAGNGVKDPATGLGAMDYLNALVSGDLPHSAAYAAMSADEKGDKISAVLTAFRKKAKQQLLAENYDLRAMVEAQRGADLLEGLRR